MKDFVVKLTITFFAVFGSLWTLLDPLGGLEALQKVVSEKTLIYLVLCSLSFAAAVASAAFWHMRRVSQSDVAVSGASRADFDHLLFIGKSRTIVRAIGISLPTFASERGLNLIESLIVQRNVTVDLIFCDPDSPAIPKRTAAIYPHGRAPNAVARDTHATLTAFKKGLGIRHRRQFNIYVARQPFGIGMIQSDDDVLWSPILANRSGATAPFQICGARTPLGRCLIDHFETMRTEHSLAVEAS